MILIFPVFRFRISNRVARVLFDEDNRNVRFVLYLNCVEKYPIHFKGEDSVVRVQEIGISRSI